MSWEFETDPEYQRELDWVEDFVTNEVEPLEHVIRHAWDMSDPVRQKLIPPLQQEVRERGLWACHLGPHLGGPGYGQVKLALLNEILGRTHAGPIVFGCQAPDSGNAEILAHYGTDDLKKRYLEPLLENEIVSAFSMTEPQGGSDPTQFVTHAELDGDEWVINGLKWFTSGAVGADVAIAMVVTDPDAAPHKRASMILVPTETPGFNLLRPVSVMGHSAGPGHCEIEYVDCRVPADNLLGARGAGFTIAQDRLGPGRIHHCMRAIGAAERALELMCKRAVKREAFGSTLAEKQFVQDFVAKSRIEINQARLLTLYAAWQMDTVGKREARQAISMIKVVAANMVMDVVDRAMQVHGSLGVSDDTPLASLWRGLRMLRLADGPDEVHKMVIAVREINRWRDDDSPDHWSEAARSEAIETWAARETQHA
jgi:acyl-CoA dehydrogenase